MKGFEMLNFENGTAKSEESGARYTIESGVADLIALRVWVQAPEGSGLPDMDIAETAIYSTEGDAMAAAEQLDQVAKKAREAMEVAHALHAQLEQATQIMEQIAQRQQSGMQFGQPRPAFNEPPRPSGQTFGFTAK